MPILTIGSRAWRAVMTREFRRFLIVGILSTILNYALFAALYRLAGVYYVLASAIGYVAGLLLGYVLNRTYSFSSVIKSRAKEFAIYASVYLASLFLSIFSLRIAVQGLGMSPLLGNGIVVVIIVISNFFGLKLIAFNAVAVSRLVKLKQYCTPLFFTVLTAKIVSSFLFASHFATNGFLPFINYFVDTLKNPYDYFIAHGTIVFPYPAGMLMLTSAPFIFMKAMVPQALYGNLNFQLFLLRLPVLFADVFIYFVLCYLLPFKEKKVFWLYFVSPILFYINYFHGQLDVIPTAMLVASLFFLLRGKNALSFLLLGVGIAIKTHLLAAIPFYCIYFYRNKASIGEIARNVFVSLSSFVLINLAFVSAGFLRTVFNNPEQARLFYLFVPFGFKDLKFFIAPAILLFIFYKFASYKKLNKDSLLLIIGLIYTVLVSVVPPTQGWFYWALPFLVFFFVKFKNAPILSFWAMNAFYVLYFIFIRGSDIFQSLSPIAPALALAPDPFTLLQQSGFNAAILESMLFTGLEASLLVNMFWAYGAGISSNKLYQKADKPLVIGIGGDSGVGKSTLAALFEKVVGKRNLVTVNGDDVHKWERGHENWKVATHLNPKSNFLHIDLEQAMALLRGENVERPAYNHETGRFERPATIEAKKFILFQGVMPFVLERMRNLFNFKIYMEADEDLRVEWKLARDEKERGKTRENIREEILKRQDDARKFIHPQKKFADMAIRYYKDGGHEFVIEYTLKNSFFVEDVVERLEQIPGLHIVHQYSDIDFQTIIVLGHVANSQIEEIAYRLFPNLIDLVENYPEFEGGANGVHQLIFLSIIYNFYKLKHDDSESVF